MRLVTPWIQTNGIYRKPNIQSFSGCRSLTNSKSLHFRKHYRSFQNHESDSEGVKVKSTNFKKYSLISVKSTRAVFGDLLKSVYFHKFSKNDFSKVLHHKRSGVKTTLTWLELLWKLESEYKSKLLQKLPFTTSATLFSFLLIFFFCIFIKALSKFFMYLRRIFSFYPLLLASPQMSTLF